MDALVVLGGNGTNTTGSLLFEEGLNVVGLPKTIDNDIVGTDITFGFHTAVDVATEAIDRIHTTAHSHSRVMVVEVMGHKAGWLGLYSAIAGGGDVCIGVVQNDVAVRVDFHNAGKRQSVFVFDKAANPVRHGFGKHRQHHVRKVNARCAFQRLCVQNSVLFYIMRDVRDMDVKDKSVTASFNRYRVVKVFRVGTVDCNREQIAIVCAFCNFFLIDGFIYSFCVVKCLF